MIDSLNNKEVLFYKKLRESKYIKENNMFIVEGEHLVNEAEKSGNLLKVLTSDENYKSKVEIVLMKKKCLEKISLLKSVPSVMGVVKLKNNNEIMGDKIVILDDVQDPGNVGTIIRSAKAFNVSSVILSKDSVNIYNDKLIRSTQGMIFNINVIVMDIFEAIEKIKKKKIDCLYADMYAKKSLDDIKLSKYALILGSEGQGVSDKVKEKCDYGIKIEMNKSCESLNVGVSASIIMYKFR